VPRFSFGQNVSGRQHSARHEVLVSKSLYRDGLETWFSNVSVSSRLRANLVRSLSCLEDKIEVLGLVSVLGHFTIVLCVCATVNVNLVCASEQRTTLQLEKLIGKPEIRFTGFKPVTGLQNVQPVVEFL